ncbi:MAG: SMP-30/gluconolactonase/LRE family protein [Mycobacterium sp.]|nr:SMP-30/gluconolactonase/LRE family protein [Mycobacterium sp.]
MTTAVQVTDPVAGHGEGPVWSDGWGGLRWVDMFAGDVLSLDTTQDDGGVGTGDKVGRQHVGPLAAALRPRLGGGAVVALERHFALLDSEQLASGGSPVVLGEVWSDPSVRFNDGGCDPDGRFYCGTMAYDESPGRGALYRLDIDGTVTTVLEGASISNGLAWSPDGGTAYYVDTHTYRIDAFDYTAQSGLSGRRTVVRIEDGAGGPDGLTVDAEGYVWVALWGGSAVRRYTPDGRLDGIVELPVSQVTACTFGGTNLDQLFVTTSQQQIEPGSQPAAGALFSANVGVRGVPVLAYGG